MPSNMLFKRLLPRLKMRNKFIIHYIKYARIRVSENPYSTIFYAVIDTKGKPFLAM